MWCYGIVNILQCNFITDEDLDDDKIDDGDVDANVVKVDIAPNSNDIDDLLLFGSDYVHFLVQDYSFRVGQ